LDTLISSWILACVVLTAVAVGVAMYLRRRRPVQPFRPLRETATVALVRRRRELTSQLRELAGDESADLVKGEARRRKGSTLDIDVLEAAVARAERNSALAELPPTDAAPLAGSAR
jgi:hypothetical protein